MLRRCLKVGIVEKGQQKKADFEEQVSFDLEALKEQT